MICVSPFLSSESGRASSVRRPGLDRLVQALERSSAGSRPPAKLKKLILARLEAEPARVETDRDGDITAVNPAFSDLCGFSFSEIKGRKPGSFLQGKDSDPAVVAELRRAILEGKAHQCELINYHKDGSPYRVKLVMEPMKESRGNVTGFKAVALRLPLA